MDRPARILTGIDRAAFAAAFVDRLRRAGVRAGPGSAADLSQALAVSPPDSRSGLYWTARITLVHDQPDIATFDAVFAAVFDNAGILDADPRSRLLAHAHRGDEPDDVYLPLPGLDHEDPDDAGGLPWATRPRSVLAGDDASDGSETTVLQRLPADLAGAAEVPFEDLSQRQLLLLGAWLSCAQIHWPTRVTRRMGVSGSGSRISLRHSMARARRTGWEPVDLVPVRPQRRRRRVVMLCDVSQSMQAQATAYLHLMRALARGTHAETFAFATRMTRLTPMLAHRSAQIAVRAANDAVADRFGGTRIAASIAALLRSRDEGYVRGAVVVIASDGWDSEAPESLGAQMERLRRRAHRIVWINPRAAAPGYQPLVSTMAAALPYCDQFLPADTFASLAAVLRAIGTDPSSRG